MTRPRVEDSALANVPVFPLPRVVLFPDALLPLHIFEPRYRKMLSDCLDAGGALVVAHVEAGPNGMGRISDVAGAGIIVEHQPLPDGRSNIVVAGSARVRLDELVLEEPPRYPYKRARASRLHDVEASVSDADCTALVATASMFAAEVKKHDPSFSFRMPSAPVAGRSGEGPGALADLCAFQLVVDAAVRQSILEELDPRVRVRRVMDQLALQHGAMLADSKKGAVLN